LGDELTRQWTDAIEPRSESPELSQKLETLTAKSVASPYFAANDFEFAYAKA